MAARSQRRFAAAAFTVGVFVAACGASDEPVVSDSDDGRTALEFDASENESAAQEPGEAVAESTVAPASTSAAPCPSDDETEVLQEFAGPPPNCLTEGAMYSALVSTTAGDITIEFDAVAAPTTVNSFVFLARNNYFDDTVCHRVIQEFVVQCGDPTATGRGGPGYNFEDELPAAGQYEVGSIAMANSGPNTNGSQFFIISGPDGAGLPPLYSLFGQVPEADIGVVTEMNARGSLDSSGIASEEVRILDVVVTES